MINSPGKPINFLIICIKNREIERKEASSRFVAYLSFKTATQVHAGNPQLF